MNSFDTKYLIAKTFIELCDKASIQKVSISDIVNATGKNRKTFYYHFDDKNSLIMWIFRYDMGGILKDKFPPRMNMIVEVITNICLFAFVLLICVIGGYLYTTGQVKQIDAALHISKAIMYASVPFTGVITMYYAIYNCVHSVRNYREGKRKLSDPLGGTA
jgi:AcrR family transcriptional regulator